MLATLLVLIFGFGTAFLTLYYSAYGTLDGTAPSEIIALVLELLVIAAISVLLLIQTWRPRRSPPPLMPVPYPVGRESGPLH